MMINVYVIAKEVSCVVITWRISRINNNLIPQHKKTTI